MNNNQYNNNVEKKDQRGTENEFLHLSFYNNNIFCTFVS